MSIHTLKWQGFGTKITITLEDRLLISASARLNAFLHRMGAVDFVPHHLHWNCFMRRPLCSQYREDQLQWPRKHSMYKCEKKKCAWKKDCLHCLKNLPMHHDYELLLYSGLVWLYVPSLDCLVYLLCLRVLLLPVKPSDCFGNSYKNKAFINVNSSSQGASRR